METLTDHLQMVTFEHNIFHNGTITFVKICGWQLARPIATTIMYINLVGIKVTPGPEFVDKNCWFMLSSS